MKSNHPVRLVGALGAALLAVLMFASLAQAATPKPGYTQFAGCPENPSESTIVTTCLTSTITSGQLHLGNKETPITSPITLSGGIGPEGGPIYFNSKGGLTKAKQKVNGGVIGLTGLTWLAEFLGTDALTLYATAELAGTAKVNTVEDIELPLKVHLENTTGVLGPKCYIGSTSNPINLHLVTGTSGALTGKTPEYSFPPSEIIVAKNGQFVDGTFSAPGANGCTLTLFGFLPISLNGTINLVSGLPAASGNYTRQNYDLEIVAEETAYP
jgi:hypothetical protein